MTDPAATAAPKPIPFVPEWISAKCRHSLTILMSWTLGIPTAFATIGASLADMLGVPEIRHEMDRIVGEHATIAKWFPLACAVLFYWARVRTAKKVK